MKDTKIEKLNHVIRQQAQETSPMKIFSSYFFKLKNALKRNLKQFILENTQVR